jgi:hypothetical protein
MPSVDEIVDALAARLKSADLLIGRIDAAPWIDQFEARIAMRLPRSYGSLVRHYAFLPFEWNSLQFFGNSGTSDEWDLAAAAFRDPTISEMSLTEGYVQFARPAHSYDPICFDTAKPAHNREFPIVRLDHEEMLVRGRIKVAEALSRSFAAMAQSMTAEPTVPAGWPD